MRQQKAAPCFFIVCVELVFINLHLRSSHIIVTWKESLLEYNINIQAQTEVNDINIIYDNHNNIHLVRAKEINNSSTIINKNFV